jgi:hypothetical protein
VKITKRQLRRLIKETINEVKEPMTVDYVYDSLMGKQQFGPQQGITRMQMAMDAISANDMEKAANKVMDALMIDDPPLGAEEELAEWLAAADDEDDIAQIGSEWGTKHFRN